jgi:hypothetical protein
MSSPRARDWKAGAKVLFAAAALAALVGFSVGATSFVTYGGVALGVVLLFGWAERVRERSGRSAPVDWTRSRARTRQRLRVIPGGRASRSEYDLEHDPSTDDPKYIM